MVGGSKRERKLFRDQERLRRAQIENALERKNKDPTYNENAMQKKTKDPTYHAENVSKDNSAQSTKLVPIQPVWQTEDSWDEVKWDDVNNFFQFFSITETILTYCQNF